MARTAPHTETQTQEHRIMNAADHCSARNAGFELRFASLFNEGRGLVFPCDAKGRVDVDALPDRARSNFVRARTLVGREFAMPMLLPHASS
jgi:hypothetical protein